MNAILTHITTHWKTSVAGMLICVAGVAGVTTVLFCKGAGKPLRHQSSNGW